ncbi:hypothetical protein HUU62_10360 [Rhodoferax sp. 4810]|nr:hypothetical protein [Rhodoferax jenense]
MPIFQVGEIVATPGALALMDKHHIEPLDFLRRHQQGDWGNLDKHDRAANLAALKDGGRLLSCYEIDHQKLWVITEAAGDDGVTRASTCFMLPEEY